MNPFSLFPFIRMARPGLCLGVFIITVFPAWAAAQTGNGDVTSETAARWETQVLTDGQSRLTAVDTVIVDNNLAGVYQLAVDNDYTIAQARSQLRVDSQQRWLAVAGLLPGADFQYTTSETDTDSDGVFLAGGQPFPNNTTTITNTDSWNLSLTQSLLDVGAWFDLFQGLAVNKQAEVQFEVALQDLLQRTVSAYVAVIRAAANLQASQAQGEAWTSRLEQVNQQFDAGLVPITDVLDAQASYDQAAAQIIRDEGALETAREQLTVITGRPVSGELWRLREDFPIRIPEPMDSDRWVEFAMDNNLEIELAGYGVEVARHGARSAAAAHLPTISMSFSLSDNESERDQTNLITDDRTVAPDNSESDALSFTATVPLFSGGATSARRRQAYANLDVQEAGRQGTIREVTQQVRTAYLQARTNVNLVRASERSLESTAAALEATQTGLEAGTRNIVDVANAQEAYSNAQRDYNNRILDYVESVIELKRLTGTLNPGDLYDLNDWLENPAQAEQ